MSTTKKTILIFGLLVIALVLILPQIDLPSTTFNELDSVSTSSVKVLSHRFAAHSTVSLAPTPVTFLPEAIILVPRSDPEQSPAVSGNTLILRC